MSESRAYNDETTDFTAADYELNTFTLGGLDSFSWDGLFSSNSTSFQPYTNGHASHHTGSTTAQACTQSSRSRRRRSGRQYLVRD